VELRLAWRPRSRLELSLSGRNLLNDRHAELANATDIFSTTSGQIDRTAYGQVVWHY
jgi:outer membrane receptor protein involved in Fe transport